MSWAVCLFLCSLVLGLVAVAANPSPFFGALGLMVVAGMGCGSLMGCGGSFLSLILFLIYLGGMLVVFAFSAALAAELHPEGWDGWPVKVLVVVYVFCVALSAALFLEELGLSCLPTDEFEEMALFRGDMAGVALMYSTGGGLLVLGGWVLLLTLFIVLELTRGLSRGALRAV